MPPDAFDVPLHPDAVLERVRSSLGRPPRRMLGLKVEPEYVGVIEGRRFEVWERRRQAVHLLGTVSGVRGGSRVELESTITGRARVLIGLFLALLGVFAYGITTMPGERALPELTPVFAVLGVASAPLLFWWISRTQRAALHAWVRGLFAEPATPRGDARRG
ncbi:MAG TPA: hypothetical protein VFM93_10070 [Candidatus Limnocylindria bacterium]|nr:hypothetical protein [Candidatus Limnocylindria bacterium]